MNGKNRVPSVLTLIVLTLGAAGILAGVLWGGPQMVYAKAIRVCMECIGIG